MDAKNSTAGDLGKLSEMLLKSPNTVNRIFHMNMLPIGIHGKMSVVGAVSEIPERDSERDRVAIIYKEDSSLENFGICREDGDNRYRFWNTYDDTIAIDKVNVLTVMLAKGLEFERVIVYLTGMSEQEKYVACTRALNELYILDKGPSKEIT